MKNNNYFGVEIHINGNRAKLHEHDSRFYLEARENSEFEILIENKTNGRILAIPSIDGLDALTGKPADSNSGGYIIDAYGSYKVKGFRVSDEKVAAFKFAQKEKSYASSQGKGDNEGIISVRCYAEKIKPIPSPAPIWDNQDFPCAWPKKNSGDSSGPLYNSNVLRSCSLQNSVTTASLLSESRGFDIGTEFGNAKASQVVSVEFEKGNRLGEINIYYASRQSLIEMGVPMQVKAKVVLPKGFKDSYCPIPPGWKE